MNEHYLLMKAEAIYKEEYNGTLLGTEDRGYQAKDRAFVDRLIAVFLKGDKIKNWKEIIENGN